MTTVEFTPKDFCESAKENSIKFQNAMDEVSKIGGGKIILTKGEYVFATVFMKSNQSVVAMLLNLLQSTYVLVAVWVCSVAAVVPGRQIPAFLSRSWRM